MGENKTNVGADKRGPSKLAQRLNRVENNTRGRPEMGAGGKTCPIKQDGRVHM